MTAHLQILRESDRATLLKEIALMRTFMRLRTAGDDRTQLDVYEEWREMLRVNSEQMAMIAHSLEPMLDLEWKGPGIPHIRPDDSKPPSYVSR